MLTKFDEDFFDGIHPGEILQEEFLKPLKLTAYRLASDIDVPSSRISDIIRGKRPITVDTALRLGSFFNMSSEFWLDLQNDYDLEQATQYFTKEIQPRIRVFKQNT
jgi:addiction module HigA family antidote